MSKSQGLLLATVALSLYGIGNVWPVQVSSYRLYAYVGAPEFHEYHLAWWHSIWAVILAPAVVLFFAAALMLLWRPPGVPTWSISVGLALQLALLLGTAAWWGPLMAHLEDPHGGLDVDRYRLLMSTHWLRVALVTAYGGLTLWMLATSWASANSFPGQFQAKRRTRHQRPRAGRASSLLRPPDCRRSRRTPNRTSTKQGKCDPITWSPLGVGAAIRNI